MRLVTLNYKATTSFPFSGSRNSRRAAGTQAEGVRSGEQTENGAWCGTARGQWVCSLRLSSRLLSIGVYTAYLIKLNKVFSWKRTKISCFIGTVLHIISQTNSAQIVWPKSSVCYMLIFVWVRYEERAPNSSRWDKNIGGSDPEKTEEWVLINKEKAQCALF